MRKFKLSEYKSVTDFTQFEMLSKRNLIMAKCYDCCAYSQKEVRLCSCKTCPLYVAKENYLKRYKKVEENLN